MKPYAIVKYNGGRLALLCSGCKVILKTGKDFTAEEQLFAKGDLAHLPPRYCETCEGKNILTGRFGLAGPSSFGATSSPVVFSPLSARSSALAASNCWFHFGKQYVSIA